MANTKKKIIAVDFDEVRSLRAEVVRLQGVSKANRDRAVEFWNDRQRVFAELEDRRAEVARLNEEIEKLRQPSWLPPGHGIILSDEEYHHLRGEVARLRTILASMGVKA